MIVRTAFGIAILLLVTRTALRAHDWADPARFYEQTIQAGGGSLRVKKNLAGVYRQRGEIAKAEQLYFELLERYPEDSTLLGNYGNLLVATGRKSEAETVFARAEALPPMPGSWQATVARASLALLEGKPDQALAISGAKLEQYPFAWPLVRVHARALDALEGPGRAVSTVQPFAERYWWLAEPRLFLADLHVRLRAPEAALTELRHAARLDVWSADPWAAMARIELARGHLPEALRAQERVVRLRSSDPEAHLQLAEIYRRLGSETDALAAEAIARRLNGSS